MGEVNPGGLDQAQVVDTAVLEEAPVLNRQNGVDQNLGNVLVGDQLAFGALAVGSRCALLGSRPLSARVGVREKPRIACGPIRNSAGGFLTANDPSPAREK